MTSRSNLSARVDAGLRQFARHMADFTSLEDGALTARVVGEFSAGKTRFVTELLGDVVPEALTPVSSKEVQTRLPLEVTYSPVPQLTIVERSNDVAHGQTVAVLERFPTRADIEHSDYLPEQHRLRLGLPIEQLILPHGDGHHADQRPRRLFLIDMPGWNSGEDEIAEQDPEIALQAELSLALVYVTPSIRLDSAANRQRLHAFLKVMQQDLEFLCDPKLIVIVTYCSSAERARLTERARALVVQVWSELGQDADSLTLDVLGVDFKQMDPAERADFRQRFWTCLLAPLAQRHTVAHPWTAQLRVWPEAWDVRPRLAQTHALLRVLRDFAERAQCGGQFLRGMNMHRLMNLSDEKIAAKLDEAWRRQTLFADFEHVETALDAIELDAAHPLAQWWHDVWFDQTKLIVGAARLFFTQAQAALNQVSADTTDLEAHLHAQLTQSYARLQAALGSRFARLIDAAAPLVERDLDQALATLLAMSALHARYESQYLLQLQRLRQLPQVQDKALS